MSESEAVVRRLFDEVFGQGKAEVLDEVMAPDLAWHGGSFGEIRGLDRFKQFIGQFVQAFPDLSIAVDDVVGDGDKVAARLTVRGTHSGELMGVPPSGVEATWFDINIYRVDAGRIAEIWFAGDYVGMLAQIGAIRFPPG